jgi:hypothetical protein
MPEGARKDGTRKGKACRHAPPCDTRETQHLTSASGKNSNDQREIKTAGPADETGSEGSVAMCGLMGFAAERDGAGTMNRFGVGQMHAALGAFNHRFRGTLRR